MHVLKWLICLTAGIMGAWTGHCEASEAWKGEVTVRLNVRQAPQGNSPVITQLEQGAAVAVTDEKEGWYKVVVEEETFGFMGWVYGKYVKQAEKIEETPLAGPASTGPRPMEGTATAGLQGQASPAADHQETLHGQMDSPLLVHKISSGPGTQNQETPAGPKPSLQKQRNADQPPVETAVPGAQMRPNQGPTQDDSPQADLDCASPDHGWSSHGERSGSIPHHDAASPPALQLETAAADRTDMARPPQAPPSMEAETNGAGHPQAGPAWGAAMGITVKIVTVAFSCLALLFAYRAWQIARRNRD